MEISRPTRLSKGVLTISLDFELIWGTIDKPSVGRMRSLCLTEREEVVGRLLALFDQYSVSATWCTVGHLFLDRCSGHPGTTDPRFDLDPCTSEQADPIFYGRSLVRQISHCRTAQEIGCHSFSHVNFAACGRERAEAELRASVQAARELGIKMTSFVFPRNRVGHLDLLPRYGFHVFRGPDRTWHESVQRRKWYHRAGHMTDVLFQTEPPTVLPEWNANGLWDVPGSMLYTPSYGFRQSIPVAWRVERAEKGLRRAAEEGRIFHLWFHPTDLVIRQRAMVDGLRRILDSASKRRSGGELEVLPMCGIPKFANAGLEPVEAVQ